MKIILPLMAATLSIVAGCQSPDTRGEKFLRHPKAVIVRETQQAATPATDTTPATPAR